MVKKIRGVLKLVYWTIAGPEGLWLSLVMLLTVINTIITKVYLIQLLKEECITVLKANIWLAFITSLGFILATIIHKAIEEDNNERSSEQNQCND